MSHYALVHRFRLNCVWSSSGKDFMLEAIDVLKGVSLIF